jgi:hypothetical protein
MLAFKGYDSCSVPERPATHALRIADHQELQ